MTQVQTIIFSIFLALTGFPAFAENLLQEDSLLLEDDFSMDGDGEEVATLEGPYDALSDIFRLSLVRQLSYGSELSQSSIGGRIELDTPLWSGAYARMDYQVDHYYSPDSLARLNKDSYTNRNLKEAWLQLSYADCVAKIGKQTLFWGRVEGAYALDLISPLDLTKPLLTDFSDIRLASEMALFRCYHGDISSEIFYQADTQLNQLSHFKNPIENDVNRQLGDEWGGRLSIGDRRYDISFNFAKLYSNQYAILTDRINYQQRLLSQKYHLYGLSLGVPSGSIMYELDVGHKTKYLSSVFESNGVPERIDSSTEFALGFEYLSPSNHQINGGVWRFKILDPIKNKAEYAEVWNITWAKSYLNDNLDLSVLTSWLSQHDVLGLNVSSEYDINDSLQLSLAANYSSRAVQSLNQGKGAKVRTFLKLEAQF